MKKRLLILNAKDLRKGNRLKAKIAQKIIQKNEIYIILDNVLDTYNIGSIFRLADAVAAKRIYLCKGTETPPNHRIKKASINTTEVVDWEYKISATDAINDLRAKIQDIQIIGIEQTNKAVPYDKFEYKLPLVLIVGNESDGMSKEVLKLCDRVVELPMFGVNRSLNVMVSLGIVLYRVLSALK